MEKLVLAPRASTILYNLLVTRRDRRPFLLQANICSIVPLTFMKAGMPFEFVDIAPVTPQMDLQVAAHLLATRRFGGLLYAHTYGDPSTPLDFFSEIKTLDPSILLIDDRALCVPDLVSDPESHADVVLYSTGCAKTLDLGFGGYGFMKDTLPYRQHVLPYCVGDREAQEEACRQIIATGNPFVYQDSNWLQTEGVLPEWSVYCRQIQDELDANLAKRRIINAVYLSRLPAEMQLPSACQIWRFNLCLLRRNDVLKAIFAAGLFASAHYTSLAGIMAPGICPYAEKLASVIINLFNDHHFTTNMAEETCDIILKLM